MPSDREARGSTRIGPAAFAPAIVVATVAIVLLATSPAWAAGAAGPQGRWTGNGTWTNGLLVATAAPSTPGVTVAPASSADTYGMAFGIVGVSEALPNGTPAGSADMPHAQWGVLNRTTSSHFEIVYFATVRVIAANGSTQGWTFAAVDFTASGAGIARDPASTAITVNVSVSSWPWKTQADSLELSVPLWPRNSQENYLASIPNVDRISCNSNATTAPLEYFAWDSYAVATGPAGQTTTLVTSAVATASSAFATVHVSIPNPPQPNSTIRYGGVLGLWEHAPPPPVPLYVLAIGSAAAVIAGSLLALVMRSVWKRAPSLQWVEGTDGGD